MNRGLPPTDPSRVTAFPKRLVALLALAVLFGPLPAPSGEAPKPRPTARLPFLRRHATPARSAKIVVETDPDYEPEGSVPPKLPFLRRYAKPAPRIVRRARPKTPAPAPIRRPAAMTANPSGPPAPYAASPASAPTKNLPLDPSLKPGEKDPNRSIRLDMTRPYLR